MTELELQKRLAAKLPELIFLTEGCGHPVFRFTDRLSPRITPREWPWIVSEVEKAMNQEQRVKYLNKLRVNLGNEHLRHISDFDMMQATVHQRATALAQIGVI